MNKKPIGIFDSGLGGLTVLKEIKKLMPNEDLIYFGDSKRAPYGTKSKETIINFSCQNTRFLLENDIKAVVIACNTASSNAIDEVRSSFDIPVIEVIGPGVQKGIECTKNKKIGVIGTSATIESGEYERKIKELNKDAHVYSKACPLFVPLVEEGREWWTSGITKKIAEKYLIELKEKGIDALVLGCTHYPLLTDVLNDIMGSSVTLVNSAASVALKTKQVLESKNMLNINRRQGNIKVYTSDSIEKFLPLCKIILDQDCTSVSRVDIESY